MNTLILKKQSAIACNCQTYPPIKFKVKLSFSFLVEKKRQQFSPVSFTHRNHFVNLTYSKSASFSLPTVFGVTSLISLASLNLVRV